MLSVEQFALHRGPERFDEGVVDAGGIRPRRCMRRWVLYQWTQLLVMSSTSARVRIGPFRKGDPVRMASVLYSPIVVSARALSKASPTVPTEGTMPARVISVS